MNRLFHIVLSSLLLLLSGSPEVAGQMPALGSGRIERHENFASKFIQPRNVDVWLPDNYDGKKKFAVLYMHDGQMLFDSTLTWNKLEWGVDETMGSLLRRKLIKDCIVVAIWNNGRMRFSEYFPKKVLLNLTAEDRAKLLAEGRTQTSPSLVADSIVSDNYLKFMVTELKPFIDKKYKTLKSRKHTMVAGSSMGGLISWYAICEYPMIFGGAACISTHWPGLFRTDNNPLPAAMMKYLKGNLPSPGKHKLYFDYGNQTLDALYKPYQLEADEIIKNKGYNSKNWTSREFKGKDHSERAWKERLSQPLLFLLGQ
jgi:enterochelin esterase-like enzyme